jgi:hypothetical protein
MTARTGGRRAWDKELQLLTLLEKNVPSVFTSCESTLNILIIATRAHKNGVF